MTFICLNHISQQSEYERLTVEAMSRDLADDVAESNVLVYVTDYRTKIDLQLAYELPEAKFLRLEPEYLSITSVSQVLKGFNPEFAISNTASLNIGFGNTALIKRIDGIAPDLYLYKFNAGGSILSRSPQANYNGTRLSR